MSWLREIYFKQQFYPGILGLFINPFYLARKGLVEAIGSLSHHVGGKTLDVGCGKKPYEKLFTTSQYIGLEFDSPDNRDLKKADFFYDGVTFPFTNDEFDAIVCNQVLEHVFTPDNFLLEIHRVMKDEGVLLLTVPFIWDEHEQPFDFARYSSFGLKSLLNQNGFDIIEQHKTLTDVRVIFQLINTYIYKITATKNGFFNLGVAILLMSPINIIAILTSWVLPSSQDLYLDNVVLARKRSEL